MKKPKAPKNLMASTWTKAALIRRSFKAGRPRQADAVLGLEQAIVETRLFFIRIRQAMLEAGIKTTADDVQVAIVLMSPDGSPDRLVFVCPIPRDLARLHETLAHVAALQASQHAMPLGIAVWLRDREVQMHSNVSTWVQPWLTGPRAKKATEEARRAFELSGGGEIVATF